MALKEILSLASLAIYLKNENLDFINLQYGDHDKEIKRLSKKLRRKIFLMIVLITKMT